MTDAARDRRFAVLASGSGTNLQAIIDACERGEIASRLAVVISNRPGSGALARADVAGVPAVLHDHREFPSREAFEGAMIETLEGHGVDLVVLAGFMRLLTPHFVGHFRGRILNTHPSLLPAFRGKAAPRMALERGVKLTGCTIHVVTEEMDDGPILAQTAVEVRDDDTVETLTRRIQAAEHDLYPQVVARALAGPLPLGGPR